MKKIVIFILMVFISYTSVNLHATISIDASSAILIEKDSKRILYEKNIHERQLTASIAKIMTAIVALENGKLQGYYEVDLETTKQIGSSLYLQLGDKVKLIDLIYGLMLRSGNDAAYLIATSVSSDLKGFVYLMNETAKKIGMKSSSFSNPSGLDEITANYSTAYDMALLMAYALNNETFRKITSTKSYVCETAFGIMLYFSNKHRLVQTLDYVTGGKTGYTTTAKRTLVTSAKKDGMELIAVTFNCGNDWNTHKALFDYGYKDFKMCTVLRRQIIKVNDYLYEATPVLLEDVKYPVRFDEDVKAVIVLLKKPGNKQIIGHVKVYINDVEVHKVDLYRYY